MEDSKEGATEEAKRRDSGDYELGEVFQETEENIFLSEEQQIEKY